MREKRLLLLILALYLILAVTYALKTPVFEASDELWHYPLIRHLADGNPLPVQSPGNVGPWKQQASQPPLYYYLGAALTFWIDTADMESVRWLNPHVDNGVITSDGNINLIIQDPGRDPWSGTLLAVRVVRLFSVLLGVATVYLTYRIAGETAPERPEIALGAAAITAFMPMFLFISGAVNNDNLVIALSALALLLMIRMVTRTTEKSTAPGQLLLLGFVIGLAALAKFQGLGLMLLALGTLYIVHWKQRRRRRVSLTALLRLLGPTLLDWLVIAGPFVLVAGWWYWRNKQLYGDWLGWSAFFDVLGVRQTAAPLAQLWDERAGFMMSYWGLFGGVNVPMDSIIYQLLNGALLLSLVGFIIYAFKAWRGWSREYKVKRGFWGVIAALLDLLVDFFPLLMCLLWSAAIVSSLTRWATVTWSSQGRLVFAALPTLSTLLILGLVGWLPERTARLVTALLATFMLVIGAAAPWIWIAPAYQPDNWQKEVRATNEVDVVYGDALRLVSYTVQTVSDGAPRALQPGDSLDVILEWEVLKEMDRDWSAFVHLNDPVLGVPIAQRDMYPRQGLVATRLLAAGDTFSNTYHLTIPTTAVAPAALELAVGWYDFTTFERLPTEDGDAPQLIRMPMEGLDSDRPNPLTIPFEDRLLLVGYSVTPRRVLPGESMELELYWEAMQDLEEDYTFFAQVISPDTTRWASADFNPEVGTSQWIPGEARRLVVTLPLADDTPPAVYPLIVGAYTRSASGDFERLQRVTEDGRLTDDFLILTPIRVDLPE